MGRPSRSAVGGVVYHALNRANARVEIFSEPGDYTAFEEVLAEAKERVRMRLLAYCVMPNHWHMVLWPFGDGDLTRFVGWVTLTHTQRWHHYQGTVGSGHLYQGRFKSFPVQSDEHLLTVVRYVEANALVAGLAPKAEDWRWCSLARRAYGRPDARTLLDEGPTRMPPLTEWVRLVNQRLRPEELDRVSASINRGRPFGDDGWTGRTAEQLGLTSTLRRRGRPSLEE
jgi:putative transposase